MSEHKHTPGPWQRNIKPATRYPTVFSGRNKHVCEVSVRGLSESEIEANIDLIAAAPDLLAACERLLAAETYAYDEGVNLDDHMRHSERYALLTAAIAKARGQ